jgi:hypothetical protein
MWQWVGTPVVVTLPWIGLGFSQATDCAITKIFNGRDVSKREERKSIVTMSFILNLFI